MRDYHSLPESEEFSINKQISFISLVASIVNDSRYTNKYNRAQNHPNKLTQQHFVVN